MNRRLNRGAVSWSVLAIVFAVASAGVSTTASAGEARKFRLVNESGRKIQRIFASHSDSNWGEDRLGQDVLPAGHSMTLEFAANTECQQNIKIVFEGDSEIVRNAVETCEAREFRLTPEELHTVPTRALSIFNESGHKAMRVYTSVNESEWGEDRLGQDVLPSGHGFNLEFVQDAPCEQNIKIVFEGDISVVRKDVDTCHTPELLLNADEVRPVPTRKYSIVNESGRKVMRVYVSVNESEWGEDRLGEDTLPAGHSFFVQIPEDGPCEQNFKMVFEGDAEVVKRNINTCNTPAIRLTPEDLTRTEPGTTRRISLVNATGRQVNNFYGSDVDTDSWGEDRLGEGVLADGQSVSVQLPGGEQCFFDLKAVLDDGTNIVRNRVDICHISEYRITREDSATTPEGSTNPSKRVKLVNDTGRQVTRFYGSNTNTTDWEEDILGEDVLAAGQSVTVNFSTQNYCLYDFKAVLQDGSEIIRKHIDVCNTSVFHVIE